MAGAFFGGLLGFKRSAERYNTYSQGKKFLSHADAVVSFWVSCLSLVALQGL